MSKFTQSILVVLGPLGAPDGPIRGPQSQLLFLSSPATQLQEILQERHRHCIDKENKKLSK